MEKSMRFTCSWTTPNVVDSDEVKPGVVLDFNAQKHVVGIEVLDFKRRLSKAT